MGFAHSLEVLYALLRLYASGAASSSSFSDAPYPHLQQRLQQTLRAVALTAFGAVFIPLLLLCLLPLLSPLEFPGFSVFLLVIASLWASTVAHLTLRYALLPTPRRAEAEPVRGRLQAAVCAIVVTVTRVREQPQLPVLLLLCVIHSYVWKIVLYYGMASSIHVATSFGSFAVAGGLVSFVSFVLVEKSLAEDPFVLDPRAAFVRAMQRDVVRAVRRGVLVYILGRVWSWVFGGSDVELATTESGFFSLHSSRVTFQVTTSFMENLAILSAASVFRILLFRASHQVVGGAFGGTNNLWDSLASMKFKEGDVASALFATEVTASPQNVTPLNEQYLHGLHSRMDAAVKKISDKKTPKVPADAEDVEILDSLFKFENLLTGCKFDATARETLFTSRDRWNALFNSTTAVVNGFTLMLQLLNTLPDRKGDTGDNASAGALALEQSFGSLLRFLNTQQDAHPLLLLQQYPHLASLRISSSSVKSSIKFFFESKLQFAVRRFLMEEARRRVFQRTKVVRAAESLLCHLVSVSRAEDKQGIVQHTVPAVVSSLLECRNALDAYMETCLKESSTTDVYVQEATALAKGIDSGIYRITEVFQGELSLFAFPPGVKKALLAYASFNA
ncbi:Nucleoporin protein Ndc1-Nup [Phytophthora infestans]|uniref:Nucleoporin protein Ndc1-Nup n=1 Tax=Phytophthora infestans TaxID=4787 RepID=A0A833THM3_PHYIN|nr:Nucleoporin protein Ndc1-Nup [Phytophthora infestans]KAF4131437.1 Nucleoporin protein Ndc1-Nup [Phytophthora infestans]